MEFVLDSFWSFVGTLLLIGAVAEGVAKCIAAWRGKKD